MPDQIAPLLFQPGILLEQFFKADIRLPLPPGLDLGESWEGTNNKRVVRSEAHIPGSWTVAFHLNLNLDLDDLDDLES